MFFNLVFFGTLGGREEKEGKIHSLSLCAIASSSWKSRALGTPFPPCGWTSLIPHLLWIVDLGMPILCTQYLWDLYCSLGRFSTSWLWPSRNSSTISSLCFPTLLPRWEELTLACFDPGSAGEVGEAALGGVFSFFSFLTFYEDLPIVSLEY